MNNGQSSPRPAKRFSGMASSGPGRLYPVGGTKPNTSPKSSECPDLRRTHGKPTSS